MKKLKNEISKKHTKSVPEPFEDRKKAYDELKELRQSLKKRKQEFVDEAKKKRLVVTLNKKRKEENQLKSGTYDIIKNPEKIKKWKTKARQMIRNVPKEIFYSKYFNKE